MYKTNLTIRLAAIVIMFIMQLTLTSANPGITIDVTPVNSQILPTENATYSIYVKSYSTEL